MGGKNAGGGAASTGNWVSQSAPGGCVRCSYFVYEILRLRVSSVPGRTAALTNRCLLLRLQHCNLDMEQAPTVMDVLCLLCSITQAWTTHLPQAASLRGGAVILAAGKQTDNKNLKLLSASDCR